MIKVAIIGCGKMADQHAAKISKIPQCKIVGVCDKEILMAKQLSERFNVENYYNDAHEMLTDAKPDIVHIVTPAHYHYDIAKQCMEAGCHLYVEKPFTLYTTEAEDLLNLAEKKNVKITVGHNLQFTHAAKRMRNLVHNGYLGAGPLHMESYYCYDLSDQRYAKALLGDKNHWVRTLPGKLLHNVISHGVSKIAEFIQTDNPTVVAHGFTSPLLKSIDETDIVDELRVIVSDNNAITAYFTFSSQMRPVLRHLRLYGSKNAIYLDDDTQTLIKVQGNHYKSYLNSFLPPFIFAGQYMANTKHNLVKFMKNEFHSDVGLKILIESFYRSVTHNTAVPIPYREILLTSKIMDMIFEQISPAMKP